MNRRFEPRRPTAGRPRSRSRRKTLLTNVRVEIGPIHLGDQELSRDLLRRISLNFGTMMTGLHPDRHHAAQAIECVAVRPSKGVATTIIQLDGEGLRPNENRDKPPHEESPPPDQESLPASSLPALLQGLIAGRTA